MATLPSKTIFEQALSAKASAGTGITREVAAQLFEFFMYCPLFRWQDANNDCEDRANAICILLDAWNIPNFKGWLFGAKYFKNKIGGLKNFWNFHVAALLPVEEDNQIQYYIIDPATSNYIQTIEDWADGITAYPFSHYIIKPGNLYIFSQNKIRKDEWFKRNKRNYNWTIQGLSGINGLSSVGKAHLSFSKQKVEKTGAFFKELMKNKPEFLR